MTNEYIQPTTKSKEAWQAIIKGGQVSDQDRFELATAIVPVNGRGRLISGSTEVWFNRGANNPEIPLQILAGPAEKYEWYQFLRKDDQSIKLVICGEEEADIELENKVQLARDLSLFLKD